MTFPLISPDSDFALWAVLIGVAGFGFWSDSTRFGKQVSGVGIMLVIAMLLGNFQIIPHAVPAAISASRDWTTLVTPGLMVGILGYAIANFIGVALASLLAN